MGVRLNPLEKEVLIKRYQANPGTDINDFCEINGISVTAFKNWLKKYSEEGIEGLITNGRGSEVQIILPEGVEQTQENLKREIMKLRIENERLKKNYCVETGQDGEKVFRRLKERNTK